MKLISWNVNGIRAVIKKEFAASLGVMKPDVLCLQETKAQDDQVLEALQDISGYHIYANSAIKKGYSGTAILSKQAPLSVTTGIGIQEHDQEGRVLTAEFKNYYLVNTYVPNSQNELKRLSYRQQWDHDMLAYLKGLEAKKPVMWCGDLNVAHKPIDLKNDKANYNKTAGYTQQEIDGMDNYQNNGFVDSFRHFYPEKEKYSWWSYRMNAREKNVGWRIDYFLISELLMPEIENAFILNDIYGSDHCPVGVEL
ncbi:MAG: exodeoxyribonuclease III [Nitrospirales bacterium]|nr:MAG: exodeoxyribonuclease III [Nitrospirales bacterium]